MPGYGTLLAQITSADEFPSLHRAIASGALDDEDDPDIEYLFGLARILDGIAELISRGSRMNNCFKSDRRSGIPMISGATDADSNVTRRDGESSLALHSAQWQSYW